MRLDEEDVAGMEHDVADLLMQPLTVASDGHDHCVIVAAEARVANRHSDQRTRIADNRLNQAALRPRRLEMKHIFGGRNQAADALQLHDRLDNADK